MTNINWRSLAKPYIAELPLYEFGKPIDEIKRRFGLEHVIKIASHENPFGMSPKAMEAAQDALINGHRYPDGSQHDLSVALATFLNVEKEQLVLTNGSDQILRLLPQTFVQPGEEIMYSDYAWAAYRLTTQAIGAKANIVPMHALKNDVEAMAAAITPKTRLIFIANPNNPTGSYLNEEELVWFMKKVPGNVLVVLDEAYYEYAKSIPDYPNTQALQKDFPNLVITRTFSKAYGLAGLRIGYGIAHADIASTVNRLRLPFNVNSMGQRAAIAALGDQAFVQKTVEHTKRGMERLKEIVTEKSYTYAPSVTNFLPVNVGQDAFIVFEKLLEQGVITRPIANYGLKTYILVSIGTSEEIEQFGQALSKI
jgi:histidinol-phosphate aminotransferase